MYNEQRVFLNLHRQVIPVFLAVQGQWPRLEAVVDFPSKGSGDVTTIDLISLSTEENCILFLISRYCSVMGDLGLLMCN